MIACLRVPNSAIPVFAAGLPLLLLLLLLFSSCDQTTTTQQVTIQTTGSNTMVNMAQMWAEAYRSVKAPIGVKVLGGGTEVGIARLLAGKTEIANASRKMTEAEKRQTRAATGKEPVGTIVAYDAPAVYVHKDNPIEALTLQQLAQIYGENGQITKWSQLGVGMSTLGAADEIALVGRPPTSGTHDYFQHTVLKDVPFRKDTNELPGSIDVVSLIAKDARALGYSGMGYKTGEVKFVKLSASSGQPAYEPSLETVRNHTYPLTRPLRVYTVGPPTGETKAYIDWILSPAGQEIVRKSGYIPVAEFK
jgi:phosphate transport system substrate-binding protein